MNTEMWPQGPSKSPRHAADSSVSGALGGTNTQLTAPATLSRGRTRFLLLPLQDVQQELGPFSMLNACGRGESSAAQTEQQTLELLS